MNLTAVKPRKDQPKRAWLSVGLKMMIGVGLFSNLCIGFLMVVNITAFSQIAAKTNALMEMTSSMNQHLRSGIFDLQKKYLEIPKLLKTDASEEILEWAKKTFTLEKEEILKGPDQYRTLFNRTERRDIAKGRFVVRTQNGQVVVSKGFLNKDGAFSEEIFRVYLKSDHPEEDVETITAFIDTVARTVNSEDAVKQKILNLNSLLADEAIAAEKTRNEILYQVEDIQKQKKGLVQYRLKKRNTIATIAVSAVLINLVMLYFMAYFVVERPLKHLTRVIGKINKGETVFIPFQKQKDQIGILAGAVKDFQSALTCLQKEDQRRKMERTMIQDIIQNMSGLIDTLQKKAISMKDAAGELSLLASDTEDETQGATRSAAKTVEQTDTVSYSTRQLQSAVADISIQVSKQNELVADINASLKASIADIDELTSASEQINEIVHIVDTIAGDTKLLALNARIEAARSGAAGKGFAVVAGEVRELSLQTEAANGDIAVKIESIQKVSRTITENTRKIQARIENLMDASHQISAAVEEQTSVTTGIAKNAQATTRDINDVSGRISRVNKAARTTSEFAQNVHSHSEDIAGELSDLLNETREKLSLIGLSDSLNRVAALPEQPDLSKNAA